MLRLALPLLVVSSTALADVPAVVRTHAIRCDGSSATARSGSAGPRSNAERCGVSIDGRLDEPIWQTAPRQGGFVQRYPNFGAKATEDTSFAVIYDDEAVYVGVWAHDNEPEHIRRLLTRRDVLSQSDVVVACFDSYGDRRTGYCFDLNAAGVQRDFLLFDDVNQDDTWDAVWTGDAAATDTGWTAEFRIPLSQLRYPHLDSQAWGLQVVRTVGRTQEQSSWSPWPRTSPQVVSKFGVVDGIDHLREARRLELLPYVTAGIDREPITAGDPLNDQYTIPKNFGVDLKYGLGPAFTLSATINPDFGQVEADPSQITLGPYELFYAEKRPFFLEGVDLFKLPIGNSDGSVEGEFYSRRIGAPPPNEPSSYNYIKWPQYTAIYGAAKLTGHTNTGWSVGILDAVTGRETAEIVDVDNVRSSPEVAPLTNYAVARVKRDFNDGATTLGVSGTAVDRDNDTPDLAATLHDHAYTGGVQVNHRWWDNAWTLKFSAVGSYVHGTQDAIAATQLDTNHLFQRVGATDVHFDPTRTSIAGYGATINVGRLGDTKNFRTGFGMDMRSPGLELNDLGFQQGSDRNIPFYWVQWHDEEPGDVLLNYQVSGDVYSVFSFETVESVGFEYNANAALPNLWSLSFGGNVEDAMWDHVLLRGGPSMRTGRNAGIYGGISTDNTKWLYFSLNGQVGRNFDTDAISSSISVGATVQAAPNIDLFVGPSYAEANGHLQYVTEVDTEVPHYIMSEIHQTTASMTLRLDWTFSTHLSLQAYAQPFVASGRYSEYKDVTNPSAERFTDRFTLLQGNDLSDDGSTIFIHQMGQTPYSFAKPDFDFRQLRSTVVMRWEYRPGSTIFAIWSHGQTSSELDGRFRPGHDLDALLHGDAEDIVMVKANYWFGF